MPQPHKRILDANLNRAREALRVVEDWARFALRDEPTCARLKTLRHSLAEATADHAADAIHHRDTASDAGTDIKTENELSRKDLAHVVTAAAKRLGESLRVVGECLKIDDPDAARRVERIRYAFYDIERDIAPSLSPKDRFARVRLCVLVTESLCRNDWITTVEQAIAGGADCIQLREKEMESAELLDRARRLVEICRANGVISIINDRADIAAISGADGVHLGQQDIPARAARQVVGSDAVVGVSTHNIEQARQAQRHGADYIGVGPVFPSSTKPRDFLPGLDYAAQVANEIQIPTVAIAGITNENVAQVWATGVSAIAVSSAVIGADDVAEAARRLRSAAD